MLWMQYQNHFCPSMKLVSKQRINSKYYKKYDSPQTPYHRVVFKIKELRDEALVAAFT